MSWLELDDRILEHPKFIRAAKRGGSEAIFLWLGLRAYCGQLLTDGFIPGDMFDEVRGPREPRRRQKAMEVLVAERLIDLVDGGYQMHDYLDWSKSRAQVEEQRKNGAIRSALRSNPKLMREIRTRDENRCRYCDCAVDWRDRRGPSGGTYDHVVPVSRGGGSSIENVVVACRHCNTSKHDKLLAEWGRELLPEPNQLLTGSSRAEVLVSRARAGGEGSGSGGDQGSDLGGGGEGGKPFEPLRSVAPRPFPHVGAATPAFLAVFDRYPRKDAKQEAAAAFQEAAASHPGGEEALSTEILAAFDAGMLARAPYAGPNDKRPFLWRVIANRRWEDGRSAPDDLPPRDIRRGPVAAPAASEPPFRKGAVPL